MQSKSKPLPILPVQNEMAAGPNKLSTTKPVALDDSDEEDLKQLAVIAKRREGRRIGKKLFAEAAAIDSELYAKRKQLALLEERKESIRQAIVGCQQSIDAINNELKAVRQVPVSQPIGGAWSAFAYVGISNTS